MSRDALNADRLNALFGVAESYQAPAALMATMLDKDKRARLLGDAVSLHDDLSFDWFSAYFAEAHADRKKRKQDFTPTGIADIMSGLVGDTQTVLDVASGTGALLIPLVQKNPSAVVICEEITERALPFLLLNLAMRNIAGHVCHGDSLTRKWKQVYRLTKGAQFSDIETVDTPPLGDVDTVIMNPPYSLGWSGETDERFDVFGVAPKSKADYAFVLHGLHRLAQGGTLVALLPHGVLFRSNREKTIRENLIKANLLDAVIGLPANAFSETGIPTAVVVLKKDRKPKGDTIVIDASDEFRKVGPMAVLGKEHIDKILTAYDKRRDMDKFAFVATRADMEYHEYNLNIPRYVDRYEKPYVAPLSEIIDDIEALDAEIAETREKLAGMMGDLVGATPESERAIRQFERFWRVRHGID